MPGDDEKYGLGQVQAENAAATARYEAGQANIEAHKQAAIEQFYTDVKQYLVDLTNDMRQAQRALESGGKPNELLFKTRSSQAINSIVLPYNVQDEAFVKLNQRALKKSLLAVAITYAQKIQPPELAGDYTLQPADMSPLRDSLPGDVAGFPHDHPRNAQITDILSELNLCAEVLLDVRKLAAAKAERSQAQPV